MIHSNYGDSFSSSLLAGLGLDTVKFPSILSGVTLSLWPLLHLLSCHWYVPNPWNFPLFQGFKVSTYFPTQFIQTLKTLPPRPGQKSMNNSLLLRDLIPPLTSFHFSQQVLLTQTI